jgi:type II secretory ATPase GspE/PulE/Tfp pilus assembly ATPase PilB-like protein
MPLTPNVKEAVVAKADADTIKKIAIKDGMRTMIEDGLEKVKLGVTTIDELLRVIKS